MFDLIVKSEEIRPRKMLTQDEVLQIVVAAGGQIVIDDNHKLDALHMSLDISERIDTNEVVLTAVPRSEYGSCPHCGGKVVTRERRLNGNDTCEDGHVYPSKCSIL